MNLWINWYNEKKEERAAELLRCLRDNVENPLIDNVYCLYEEGEKPPLGIPYRVPCRPTYNMFFVAANDTDPDAINIIANTDIYFDETLELVKKMDKNTCIALTRYDIEKTRPVLHNVSCSQDVWIFKGKIKKINGNFHMGKPGCDNRILWEIQHAGYKISNPALSVKSYHLHQSNIRNWDRRYDKIPPPYHLIKPHA